MSAAQRTLLSSACRRSSRLLLLLALTASLPGNVGAGQAATPDAAQTDKPSNLRPGTANWFTHPWSALLGKSPPPPPAQPKGPIPTYLQVRYPVLDSAFPIADEEHLWWLDNDRVVFMGYDPGSYDPGWEKKTLSQRRADGRETDMRVGHYVWDTRNNTVVLFRRRTAKYCFEDGVSAFVERPISESPPPAVVTQHWIGPSILWIGPFGKERPKPDIDANRLVDNRLIRRPCGLIAPPGGFGARIPLHAGWGVLERRRFDQPLLYTPRKGPPRELPLLTKDWGEVLYAPWRKQYLLSETHGNSEIMPAIWWLSQDGSTQAIAIPNTGYLSASFRPIRPGVLMTGRSRPGERVTQTPESFILGNDGSVRSIGRFSLYKYGTSPNGCRIAYQNSRCFPDPSRSVDRAAPRHIGCVTAHMIDFCQKGETP